MEQTVGLLVYDTPVKADEVEKESKPSPKSVKKGTKGTKQNNEK